MFIAEAGIHRSKDEGVPFGISKLLTVQFAAG
jgi:hypothetical protein